MSRARFRTDDIVKPVETRSALRVDHSQGIGAVDPSSQNQLQKSLVASLDGNLGGPADPSVEFLTSGFGQAVDLLVRSHVLSNDIVRDQTVAAEALEALVDLSEIELRARNELVLVGGFELVAVERSACKESEYGVFDGQDSVRDVQSVLR